MLRRAGDPSDGEAWREFDARYGPIIVGYCRGHGLQLADAEDIRQEVLIGLTRSLGGFEYQPERGRFRSYLGRVVRNAVTGHIKRHRKALSTLGDSVLDAVAIAHESGTDSRWDDQWIRHHCAIALETLRQTHDALHVDVFERLLAGQGSTEVASMFDLTPEAVRKIKQRIRDRLSEIVSTQIRSEGLPSA